MCTMKSNPCSDPFQASQIEDYFEAAGDTNKTSDRTLARLGRMDVEEVAEAMAQVSPAPYEKMIRSLQESYSGCFRNWMYLLW